MPSIEDWSDLSDEFTSTLLLGNGASMAIDPRFSYRSLLGAARTKGLITPSIQQVFDYLGTEDFELVMNMIWHASHVNSALGVADTVTGAAYEEVKSALVGAVRDHHPERDEVEKHLGPIAAFMGRFTTVLSLNYDLIVYWAILEGNRKYGSWFKDCLTNFGALHDDWPTLREPYGGATGTTLVFYPHGNLALVSTLSAGERKVMTKPLGASLLETILAAWEAGDGLPLFVSEGASNQKELAILRSHYLSTVYNSVLPDLDDDFVLYGWAAHDNDAHMLKRICRGRSARLAFSVYRGNRLRHEIDAECDSVALKVRRVDPKADVRFFWADSADCWLNAALTAAPRTR